MLWANFNLWMQCTLGWQVSLLNGCSVGNVYLMDNVMMMMLMKRRMLMMILMLLVDDDFLDCFLDDSLLLALWVDLSPWQQNKKSHVQQSLITNCKGIAHSCSHGWIWNNWKSSLIKDGRKRDSRWKLPNFERQKMPHILAGNSNLHWDWTPRSFFWGCCCVSLVLVVERGLFLAAVLNMLNMIIWKAALHMKQRPEQHLWVFSFTSVFMQVLLL